MNRTPANTVAADNSAIAGDNSIEHRIKAQAYALGFDLVGITRLGQAHTANEFSDWLDRGYAGSMTYLDRGRHMRLDSRLPVPGATSAIVVGMNYGGTEPTGPVARYARGRDYHDVMTARLDSLRDWLGGALWHQLYGKCYVDTGPILERDLARRAGLGWFGKNTNLINPGLGSFFFIGELLVDVALTSDAPFEADRCGSCTRCLDACPTKAFVAPRVLDATRCISYLTIEQRGEIPRQFHEPIGDLLYGCDICQDVCPWNVSFSREATVPELRPHGHADVTPGQLLAMTDDEIRDRFRGTAMMRARPEGLRRNAAVVMANRAPGNP